MKKKVLFTFLMPDNIRICSQIAQAAIYSREYLNLSFGNFQIQIYEIELPLQVESILYYG